MAGKIIPLPTRSVESPGRLESDELAAELLADGRAATLSAARFDVVLIQLRQGRAKLVALLEELQTCLPTGDLQLDKANRDLQGSTIDEIDHSDWLIRAIEAWRTGNKIGELQL